MPRSRRRYSHEFKLDAVRQALADDRPVTEIAAELGIAPNFCAAGRSSTRTIPNSHSPVTAI